jgi:small subunit ribosomal protein S15
VLKFFCSYASVQIKDKGKRERPKGRSMTINLKNKPELIKKYGKNAKDTGNVEVQIAMLSEKIKELTEHLKINAKDFQAKRGLLMIVGRRKRLLTYFKDKNLNGYRELIKKLKIRG